MRNIFLLFYLLCLIYLKTINAVTINALAFSYSAKAPLFSPLIGGFNEYAKKKNLDINLNLTILTPLNSTTNLDNYAQTI